MNAWAVALIIVSVVCVILLIALISLIMLLRRHRGDLTHMTGSQRPRAEVDDFEPGPPAIALGAAVPKLALTTSIGESITSLLADGDWLVAFASPDCTGCEDARPHLVEWTQDHLRRGERTLVVVTESESRIAAFVRDYPGALVAADGQLDGEAVTAFGVSTFPSYVRIGNGCVTATSIDLPGREVVVVDD